MCVCVCVPCIILIFQNLITNIFTFLSIIYIFINNLEANFITRNDCNCNVTIVKSYRIGF